MKTNASRHGHWGSIGAVLEPRRQRQSETTKKNGQENTGAKLNQPRETEWRRPLAQTQRFADACAPASTQRPQAAARPSAKPARTGKTSGTATHQKKKNGKDRPVSTELAVANPDARQAPNPRPTAPLAMRRREAKKSQRRAKHVRPYDPASLVFFALTPRSPPPCLQRKTPFKAREPSHPLHKGRHAFRRFVAEGFRAAGFLPRRRNGQPFGLVGDDRPGIDPKGETNRTLCLFRRRSQMSGMRLRDGGTAGRRERLQRLWRGTDAGETG